MKVEPADGAGGDRLLCAVLAACQADLAGTPTSIRDASARACFDALTCMTAGEAVVGARLAFGAGRTGPDTGHGYLDDVATAAMAAHALDLDDLHWGSVTHPGSIIWPSLLVVGTRRALPLSTVLEAGALGYQVVARMAELLGIEHRRAFHASTTAGVVGVAAAVASAMGHDDTAIVAAMAHAASTMGGTSQAVRQHARTVLLHRAAAAALGTLAAQQGQLVPAVAGPVDGTHGFAAATGLDLDLDRLGEAIAPVVTEVTLRVHPVNGLSHAVVDAALSLPAVEPGHVRSVAVAVPAFVAEYVETDPGVDPVHPAWHLPHIVALCLAGALPSPRLPTHPMPAVTHLSRLVEVEGLQAAPTSTWAEVRVTLADGRVLAAQVDAPHGHPDDPLSDAELVEKAIGLQCFAPGAADRLLDDLSTAETSTGDLVVTRRPSGA